MVRAPRGLGPHGGIAWVCGQNVQGRARFPGRASASIGDRDAQDEDPLRRQEALPRDREGQAARPSRLLDPHPREEVTQAQASLRAAGRGLQGRRSAGAQAAPGEGEVTRVKRSVHARKKRRATLARTKGYRGEAHSSSPPPPAFLFTPVSSALLGTRTHYPP